MNTNVVFPKSVLKPALVGALAVFLGTLSPPARAATVIFDARDLADTTPGEDLWQFSYTFEGFNFAAGQGFTIFFDRSLFTLLQSPPPPVNEGWDLLTVQRDLTLGSNGFYDALALTDSPSLENPFLVNFVWLGTGTPGPQSFTVYDTDFSTLFAGQTVGVEPVGPISLRVFASGAWIRFETAVGMLYRVEYNDDLSPAGWRVLIDNVPGDGHSRITIDAAAAQLPQRFYRLVETQPPP